MFLVRDQESEAMGIFTDFSKIEEALCEYVDRVYKEENIPIKEILEEIRIYNVSMGQIDYCTPMLFDVEHSTVTKIKINAKEKEKKE
jgi:hypothetical protein